MLLSVVQVDVQVYRSTDAADKNPRIPGTAGSRLTHRRSFDGKFVFFLFTLSPYANCIIPSSLFIYIKTMSHISDYFDDDDGPFMDDIASDMDEPLQIRHSCSTHCPRPSPTIVSGTSDLSNRSDHLRMPPPSNLPSVAPRSSGRRPEVITGIPQSKLYHNLDFLKERERVESLQHMVNILVAELVEEQHLDKHRPPVRKSIVFFGGFTLTNLQHHSTPISSYSSLLSRSK